MVKYWPDKGKSGFLVWRYLLKRDDDEPAPWTREGKERIKKLGLVMQVRGLAVRFASENEHHNVNFHNDLPFDSHLLDYMFCKLTVMAAFLVSCRLSKGEGEQK